MNRQISEQSWLNLKLILEEMNQNVNPIGDEEEHEIYVSSISQLPIVYVLIGGMNKFSG